jgi:UDP-N-acetylmuramate dehydrogenase
MGLSLASRSYAVSQAAKASELHTLGKSESAFGLMTLRRALGERALENEPMSAHTSFRIGGPADLFIIAKSAAELAEYVRQAREHRVPYLVIGRGSNLLVADRGIRGLIIQNASSGISTSFIPAVEGANSASGLACLLEAESGVLLSYLAQYSAQLGLSGLEWAVGIPGTLGGAIVGNAGAFGAAMSDSVQEATLLSPDGDRVTWNQAQLAFGYRTSALKAAPTGYVLLTAQLLLRREAAVAIQARLAEYQGKRREKQPKGPSAGSVFANPPGDHAGRLIEEAGLKGLQVGDAAISLQHANFVINMGQARASDVWALIQAIRERIQQVYNIHLELEIQLAGDWS